MLPASVTLEALNRLLELITECVNDDGYVLATKNLLLERMATGTERLTSLRPFTDALVALDRLQEFQVQPRTSPDSSRPNPSYIYKLISREPITQDEFRTRLQPMAADLGDVVDKLRQQIAEMGGTPCA